MEHMHFQVTEQVALVTINRPKVLNALNAGLFKELLKFLQVIALEENVRAMILTGAGDKAFIAGADIKEMSKMTVSEIRQFCELGQNVANALETAPFLTIAAVNGYALGGGLEMALACDFIYASKTAILGMPEVSLGLIPGFGGAYRLSKAIGKRKAKELMMSAKKITSTDAYEVGIVNRVCEPNLLLPQCFDVINEIIKNPVQAVSGVKNVIEWGSELNLVKAMELERNVFTACFDTLERKKAMSAFIHEPKQ